MPDILGIFFRRRPAYCLFHKSLLHPQRLNAMNKNYLATFSRFTGKIKKTFVRSSLLLLIMIVGLLGSADAQDTVLNSSLKGRLDSVNSTILKQKRLIQVFLPPKYAPGNSDKYDVLYVLDGGNWNTGMVTQIQQFVQGQSYMPPTIIVSVMGIDRNVELTPTHLESWKGSGGAKDFLAFIKNELIPYVNETYPSNGDNTLWGHSLSGMFVMYALLNEPALFRSYIAADPSFWWDNCLIPKMAAAKLPVLTGINATLFISGRDGADYHGMRIDTMEAILKSSAPAGLKWKVIPYEGETHSSVRLKTTYDGLKFTYAGLSGDIDVYPAGGMVTEGKPFKVWYFDDTTRLHYTLDGTLPTESSANARREITINNGGTVTYKRFCNRSRYDKTFSVQYINSEVLRPVTKLRNAKPGGFKYAYYEAAGNEATPDIKSTRPMKTGIMDKDFNPDSLHRKNKYALVVDGFVEAKEEGYYMFFLSAGKGAKLYLDNKLLIDWDSSYKRDSYSYTVPLTKGLYPIRIEYFDKKDAFKLQLQYLTPSTTGSGNTAPVPFDAQYSAR
jgi:predicted alpha/beta superfamily hydrolase